MRGGVKLVREIVNQSAMAILTGKEIFPGDDVQNIADLDQCLNSHVATQWHLSGTARMGSKADKGAVVDANGRVHGIGGLRVVDASIMPTVTNGNTNGPTIMIAEKISDHILGKTPLPRVQTDVWKNPHYNTAQR